MSVHPGFTNGTLCYDCGNAYCTCEADTADWIAADREYGRRMHRTNRLLLAIDLTEKLIDELPDGSAEERLMREKNANLILALLNHRKMGFEKTITPAEHPRQTLKGI